jgi:ubiquinone/menaquinone biosynthesis C-methylase UbiE
MGLEEISYKIHQDSYKTVEFEKELALYKNWFDKPTTDLWRHKRMLSVLIPFLELHKNANWLTVGDGRFGTSATYINKNGGKAIASDIDTTLLEIAKKEGMLTNFAYANAEKLPFQDEQFDYSYCKQAYHHFPRPILAIYEMLRVSKQAIILTEPHDFTSPALIRDILQKLKHTLKKIIGLKIPHHDTGNYESIGNYIYTISIRDLEKIAQGIGLPCIAYKLFHDAYIPGVEKEEFSENASLYKKLKSEIKLNTLRKTLHITNPNNIQAIVFKIKPNDSILNALKKEGYQITIFPKNPYL